MTRHPIFSDTCMWHAGAVFFLGILLVAMLLVAGCVGWLGGRYAYDQDVRISKMNSEGLAVWTKLIDSGNYDYALDFIQTSDGGFLILGGNSTIKCNKFPPPYPEKPLLTKISGTGNLVWQRDYDMRISDVVQNRNGGFTAVSNTGILLNLDSDGNVVDTHNPGLTGYAGINGGHIDTISALENGGFILAGDTIAKTDVQGNISWQQLNQTTLYQSFSAIEMKNHEGYLVMVHENSLGSAVLQLDQNGSLVRTVPLQNFAFLSKPLITDNGYSILSIRTICPEHSTLCDSYYSTAHLDNEGKLIGIVNLTQVGSQTILPLNDGGFVSYELMSPGTVMKKTRLNPDGSIGGEILSDCSGESCLYTSGQSPVATSDGGFAIMDRIEKQRSC